MFQEQQPTRSLHNHTVQKLRHGHLGAIIDAQGREIPITERMILQACHQLEKESPQRRFPF